MAGYHLLTSPLASARTMLHSRTIDWVVHQGSLSVPKEQVRVGQEGGGGAMEWTRGGLHN